MDIFAFYINVWFLSGYGWMLGTSDSLVVKAFELQVWPHLQILSGGSIKDITSSCKCFILQARQMLQEKYLISWFWVLLFSISLYALFSLLLGRKGSHIICSLHDSCLFMFSFHLFLIITSIEGAITYLRARRLFYTHLLLFILFQIASNSAMSLKIKWSVQYLTLWVDLTFTMSLFISMWIKLYGSLGKCSFF